MIETMNINGHTMEFLEDTHTYLVDGIVVPSVTQILHFKFPSKYNGVSRSVLDKAAEKGTGVHKAIEDYCKSGVDTELPELRNFKFLQKKYGFEVLENETPVFLEKDGLPILAGRLDLVLKMGDEIGGADIKRTSTFDKEYVAYQLNLYRIMYRQCYGKEWTFLRGVHLRDDVRKFITLPINEDMTWELIEEYLEASDEG